MRFQKPAGTILLWAPTAWALWIANQGTPSYTLLIYFLMGTFIMRAAGCVMNDIADRSIDKHVKRTQRRPLTTGELSLFNALSLLAVLLLVAFLIVIQLPITCFYYALIAVALTVIYPYCKRFLQAPQLILGLAFSMGIPMAFAASGLSPNWTMLILCMLNFAWIVAYDTLYAMVDRDDDLKIGVNSTAVLFAQYDRLAVLLLQIIFHGLWLILAVRLHFSLVFYAGWLFAALLLVYQQNIIIDRDAAACFRAFSMNSWYGMLMWFALILNYT